MAVDARWLAYGEPPGVPVRVLCRVPDERMAFGPTGVVASTAQLLVSMEDVPEPRIGDHVLIGAARYRVQSAPIGDDLGLIWTVDLAPI